jgi:predicted extracellular nuclease
MNLRPHVHPRPRQPREHRTQRVLLATISSTALVAATAVGLSAPAHAVSSDVVVEQVYGGGGNSGAPFSNDFVELFNLGSSDVDLSGWTVTYFTSTGSATAPTALTGTIAAHHAYLVQEGAGTTPSGTLPAPDATGSVNLSSASGRVDLANGTTLVDRVGYGAATTFEGTAAAPGLSNTTADGRTSPCTDTDQNGDDFSTAAPAPENTSTASPACSQPPPVKETATIDQIQGASQVSPLKGHKISDVTGVVTALTTNGYWFQSTHPDKNPSTSEGLFVFTSSTPTVQVGDDVSVDGTVSEFRSGGATGTDLSTTELDGPKTTVVSSGNALPAPVVIGVDRTPPAQSVYAGNPGDLEAPGVTFDPKTNAIDFDESLEGMRVAVRNARVVGPTDTSFGETPVVPGNAQHVTFTPHGGVLYSGYNRPNAARLVVDDELLPDGTGPVADVGDRLSGTTVGVLDYSFSEFHLLLTAAPTVVHHNLQREVTRAPSAKQLAVATFNVENLAPSDPQTKFDRLAGQIIDNLAAPDLVALEEIQDNDGATDDGVVASDQTLQKLVNAISAAGGPAYQWRVINPVNDADGGQPGGNIRQAFLFRTDRGLAFTDIPGGDSTTSTTVHKLKGQVELSASPSRIDPGNVAWTDSRKPLVGQFTWQGKPFFVIANHFDSKLGDQPIMGRFQQPSRSSEVQRHEQATEVRSFVDQIQAVDRTARVIVLGDLNDFEFSQTADILVGGHGKTALTDLPRTLPVKQRYTYVFDGNSQVLDHILITKSWASEQYDIVHTNSEFHDQDSDHDPQIVRLRVG